MSDAQPAAAAKIPPHNPIESVTIHSLRKSHLSLSRLLDDVSRRLRDMLAAKYGVVVGDTVSYTEVSGARQQMEVKSISLAIERVGPEAEEPGDVVLVVRGTMDDIIEAIVTVHWNPETCHVVRKGGEA